MQMGLQLFLCMLCFFLFLQRGSGAICSFTSRRESFRSQVKREWGLHEVRYEPYYFIAYLTVSREERNPLKSLSYLRYTSCFLGFPLVQFLHDSTKVKQRQVFKFCISKFCSITAQIEEEQTKHSKKGVCLLLKKKSQY